MSLLRKVEVYDGTDTLQVGSDGSIGVKIADGANLDAFSRLRVSMGATLFDSQFHYGKDPMHWNEQVIGGAVGTFVANNASITMVNSTSSGDKLVRQTKRYIRYQPGKSQFCFFTAVIGAKKAGVRQRIGLFDSENGLFFEQDENNLKVVRRTNVTGTPTDTAINQSAWNIDKLDGTGASGITLDMSKTHIFIIDFQWLGVGRVRYAFDINGKIYYCHEMYHANNLTEVYMSTPNLPVRYEIENTSGTASATTLKQLCCGVQAESGFTNVRGYQHAVANGATRIPVTTRRPVLSIRPKLLFNGITNRAEILMDEMQLLSENGTCFYELVYNGTLSTASIAWTDASTSSLIEYDVGSTAITGGEILHSGYAASGNKEGQALSEKLSNLVYLTLDIAGSTSDVLSVVATRVGTSTPDVAAVFCVNEFY